MIAKAADLHSADRIDRQLVAYALFLEATENSRSRDMASRVLSAYISREDDIATLQKCVDLAAGSPALDSIVRRLKDVSGREGRTDNDR